MVGNKLNIISISDIHLGHRRVKAETIIKRLNKLLPFNDSMNEVDLIVLVGDVFDADLSLGDKSIAYIQIWIVRLLTLCKRYNIVLRVLYGTPSHDRKQSKQFNILNRVTKLNVDLKYVETLSIEYNEQFDKHFLYVPDEWRGDTNQTKLEVIELLKENNIDKVDYAFMHGCFKYQLPDLKHLSYHDADFYLSITRKYIFIGHHHHMSRYDRILAQGSADRLCHGEEHDKGFFNVVSYDDSFDQDTIIFIVNKEATIFKTLNLVGYDKEEVEDILNQLILDLKPNLTEEEMHIKLILEKNGGYDDVINAFKRCFANIKWTTEVEEADSKDKKTITSSLVYKPVPINENTINGIILNRLNSLGIEEELIGCSMELLNEIKRL